MKIAEMEAHHSKYMTLEGKIRTLLAGHEFPEVFSKCLETFPNIVPMIQYRKKRGIMPEIPELLPLNVICKYGPPLFEHSVMTSLFEFIKSTRLLAKHESDYLQLIQLELEREETARVLWNHLEQNPGALQRDIYEEQTNNRDTIFDILDTWERLGVILRIRDRNDFGIYLRSILDEEVEAICQSCGVKDKGRKEHFFRSIVCKQCGVEGYYYIKYTDS